MSAVTLGSGLDRQAFFIGSTRNVRGGPYKNPPKLIGYLFSSINKVEIFGFTIGYQAYGPQKKCLQVLWVGSGSISIFCWVRAGHETPNSVNYYWQMSDNQDQYFTIDKYAENSGIWVRPCPQNPDSLDNMGKSGSGEFFSLRYYLNSMNSSSV